MTAEFDPQPANLWYTVRRYHIDRFFTVHVASLPAGARVLDLGGKKVDKRGRFDISQFPLKVEYANIDAKTQPDYLCDAARVPVADAQYDAVICAELLEHVARPVDVLREAFRLLRPEGILLLTTPFNGDLHADPQDYARYTDVWLRANLEEIGFTSVQVARQGTFFSVTADMLKRFAAENIWPRRRFTRGIFLAAVTFWVRLALRLERSNWGNGNRVVRNYTTGFSVVARKESELARG